MQEEQPEIGRFKPKGDSSKEPREPFFPDEMLEPGHKPEPPSLKGLHVPKAPLTKEKLSAFLIELKPMAEGIQAMSREDQHLIGAHLQEVKNLMHSADFSDKNVAIFEKIVDHFNELLIHSRPVDQNAVLSAIELLETKL